MDIALYYQCFCIFVVWISVICDGLEFCHNEVFKAHCHGGHVIMITNALYGRMEINRCVKTDFGYVGCSHNVTMLAHARCSARKSCEISVPSAMFDNTRPCNEDLKSYLEIEYDCVKVIDPKQNCKAGIPYSLPSSNSLIPSSVAMDTNCGSVASPFILEVLPGQQLNISLYDYSSHKHSGVGIEHFPMEGCYKYADIKETAFKRTVAICGAETGYRHIYTSMGNMVEIILYSTEHFAFLIEYKAAGCSDMMLPEGMWTRHDDMSLVVGCQNSDAQWRLECKGTTWTGEMGNCTQGSNAAINTADKKVTFGGSLMIVVGVSLGIGLCVLCVGLLCLQRFRFKSRRRPVLRNVPLKDMHRLADEIPYERGTMYAGNKGFDHHTFPYQATKKSHPDDHSDENEYEYVWDVSSPSNTNTSSLLTPDTGSPMLRHHTQKADTVQMKTFNKEDTIHRNTNTGMDKCPIHTPGADTGMNTLTHTRDKNRRLPLDIPLPPSVNKHHESHDPQTGSKKAGSQSMPQSISFPGEKTATIRYVTTGTLKHEAKQIDDKAKQNVTS